MVGVAPGVSTRHTRYARYVALCMTTGLVAAPGFTGPPPRGTAAPIPSFCFSRCLWSPSRAPLASAWLSCWLYAVCPFVRVFHVCFFLFWVGGWGAECALEPPYPLALSAEGMHGAKQLGLGYVVWTRALGALGTVQFALQRVLLSASGCLPTSLLCLPTLF